MMVESNISHIPAEKAERARQDSAVRCRAQPVDPTTAGKTSLVRVCFNRDESYPSNTMRG